MNAVSPELDRRFRDAAAAEGLLDAAFDFVDSPVGPLLVATSAHGLCRISYDADPERELEQLARDFGVRVLRSAKPIDPARRELDEYFEGKRHTFDLPVDVARLADFNRRVREPRGFFLPNTARALDFKALGGRAHFSCIPVPRIELRPGQLVLMTIRSHDQFNTTVYDVNDRYRGVFNHRHVLFMHPADLEARGLHTGDKVRITSHFRGATRQASGFTVLAYDTPRQSAAAYFPEANVLVPVDHFADKSRTPASKSVVITVTPEAGA